MAARHRTGAPRHRLHRGAPRDRAAPAGVRSAPGVDVEAARADAVHRVERPRMAREGERPSDPDAPHDPRSARALDHRAR